MTHEPYFYTKDPVIERGTFTDDLITANDRKLECTVRYDFTVVNGKVLVTSIEVKTMFTPSGYQEQVIAMIEERHPGCEFNSTPAFKMVELKQEKQ